MDNVNIVFKKKNPYLTVSKGKLLKIGGPMAEFLDYVSTTINFNYSLKVSHTNGNPVNGVWSGMMGMLLKEEADISLTPITMTFERGSAIDFSSSVFTSEKTLLVGRPPLYSSFFEFLSAFDKRVSSLFIIGLFMTLVISIISNKIVKRYGLGISLSIIDQIWLFLEILLSKSTINLPKKTWSRILLWSWMFPVIVITPLMSCKLISALSISHNALQIKTVEDVLKYPDIQPLFSKGSSEAEYFKLARISPFTGIWAKARRKSSSFRDSEELESDEILTQVERNRYVIINDRSTFESRLEDRYDKYGTCNFYITNSYLSSNLAIMFRKNIEHDFAERVNVGILTMQQFGLLDYLAGKDRKNLHICLNFLSGQNDVNPGSFETFSGIFILWSICVAFCSGQLCVEIFIGLVSRILKQK